VRQGLGLSVLVCEWVRNSDGYCIAKSSDVTHVVIASFMGNQYDVRAKLRLASGQTEVLLGRFDTRKDAVTFAWGVQEICWGNKQVLEGHRLCHDKGEEGVGWEQYVDGGDSDD
jgi:hypothetical protein